MRHFPTHSARGVVRVCLCVEHTVSCAKPAGQIEMLFAGRTLVVSVKHVLDVDAYWQHLANTIDRFVLGSDASLCQISLTTFLPA